MFSELVPQFTKQGISFARDKIKDHNFTFELFATPSLRELTEAIGQVDRAIRVAAGVAAVEIPQLKIWPDTNLLNLEDLEARLREDGEAWDLEIIELAQGSLHLMVKPGGKFIKDVTAHGIAAVTLLAGLSQITGVTIMGVAQHPADGKAAHSVVQVDNTQINVTQPSEENILIRLPPGSRLTETIDLDQGKRIVLKIQAESQSTTAS